MMISYVVLVGFDRRNVRNDAGGNREGIAMGLEDDDYGAFMKKFEMLPSQSTAAAPTRPHLRHQRHVSKYPLIVPVPHSIIKYLIKYFVYNFILKC